MSDQLNQSEQHPRTYNKDERERKIDQERQLISLEHKVDELLLTVKGDSSGSILGFSNRLVRVEHEMWGTEDRMGMTTKVALVWKSWIWLACTGSAIIGGGITQLVRYIWKI